MKCERCRVEFDEKEITNYKGQNLCEDCCFDLMNPPKTCVFSKFVVNLNLSPFLDDFLVNAKRLESELLGLLIDRPTRKKDRKGLMRYRYRLEQTKLTIKAAYSLMLFSFFMFNVKSKLTTTSKNHLRSTYLIA